MYLLPQGRLHLWDGPTAAYEAYCTRTAECIQAKSYFVLSDYLRRDQSSYFDFLWCLSFLQCLELQCFHFSQKQAAKKSFLCNPVFLFLLKTSTIWSFDTFSPSSIPCMLLGTFILATSFPVTLPGTSLVSDLGEDLHELASASCLPYLDSSAAKHLEEKIWMQQVLAEHWSPGHLC